MPFVAPFILSVQGQRAIKCLPTWLIDNRWYSITHSWFPLHLGMHRFKLCDNTITCCLLLTEENVEETECEIEYLESEGLYLHLIEVTIGRYFTV